MGANNRDQYQGLLLPDVRLRTTDALWTAESSFSQQGPHAGRPVPSGDTEALLQASGTQDSQLTLDVLAVEGGPVGRSARAAGIAWKKSTDSANTYRGREIPITTTGFEHVEYGTTDYEHHDAVTLTQQAYRGQIVIVSRDVATGDVVCWRRQTDGVITASVTVHDFSTDGNARTPCLVEAGDRLFCLYWCQGLGGAGLELFIRVAMSTDGGATWSIVRRQATTLRNVRTSISFTGVTHYQPRRLSAAYKDGQVVVLASMWQALSSSSIEFADLVAQWASPNLATRLDRVSLPDPATSTDLLAGQTRVIAHAGRFVAVQADHRAPPSQVRLFSAVSAYDPLCEGTAQVSFQAGPFSETGTNPKRQTDADVDITADDVGLLWVLVRCAETGDSESQLVHLYFSQDDGASLEKVSTDDLVSGDTGSIWGVGRSGGNANADAYPRDFALTWQRGRAVLAHSYEHPSSTTKGSVALTYLGGYSDLTVAPWSTELGLQYRHPWRYTLLPYGKTKDLAMWTAASTGTTFNDMFEDYERLRSGDGLSAGAFSVSATDSTTGDVLLVAQMAAQGDNAGASATTATTALTFRVDDGARGCEVGIYLGTTSFGVFDRVSAASLASVTGLQAEPHEFRVAVYGSESGATLTTRIWYRSWKQTDDRLWTFVGAFNLTDDSGTVGTNRVAFGAFTSTTQIADLFVYGGPCWSAGNVNDDDSLSGSAYLWSDWSAATHNPALLGLTPLSPRDTYLNGGVFVRGVDGPAFKDDAWTISAAHEYPVERLWPSYARSSRVRWRSVDDAAQQSIAVAFDAKLLGTDESHPGAPLYALWLDGINWRTGELQAYAGGGWVKVADIDASEAFGTLAYSREGNSILPNGDTTNQMAGQELVGWDWRPFTGGIVRRITANRGGRWATGTSAGPRVRMALDGVDPTDPTSGSCYLSARQVCVVFEHAAADTASGWRIVIDAQDTVEGHFEVGTMQLGPVWVSGQVPDWGRGIDQRLGTAYAVRQDGSAVGSKVAPASYAVDVAWTGGVDSRQFHNGTTEPTYVTTTSTAGIEGAATWAATVYDLQHELAALGAEPLVYLPKLERGATNDTRTLTRWFEVYPARVTDGLSITSTYGDEGADETFTVATMTLEPEL